LEIQNRELAKMIEDNNKLLKDLSLQNKALSAAVGRLAKEKKVREDSDQQSVISGSESANRTQHAHPPTPEKKRTSKKSSSELVIERTPPKPPEGTPQRQKKTRISESPLSVSNRYEPLASAESDDEISFADAEESNLPIDLDPVSVPGETDVQEDDQATATLPPSSSNHSSPGSGSNGVGQSK
jgi:hypothetical protein